MDVISLGKAKKAKKEVEKLNNRLGVDEATPGEDVRGAFDTVKERLEDLEEKDPKVTFYNRISEVEKHTHINLNKHNLRVASLLNQKRYQMKDMIVDDFLDDSGVDQEKSVNVKWEEGKVAAVDPSQPAEMVTVEETADPQPEVIVASMASNENVTANVPVNLEDGVFENTELVDGKVQLQMMESAEQKQYSPQGTYESPIIDLGENVKDLHKVESVINSVQADDVKVYTATSQDGISFSDYALLNTDNTIASPAGRYIKVKAVLTGAGDLQEKLAYDFSESERSDFQENEYVVFEGSGAKLKTEYSLPMEVDSGFTGDGTLLRKTIDKASFESVEKVGVK